MIKDKKHMHLNNKFVNKALLTTLHNIKKIHA